MLGSLIPSRKRSLFPTFESRLPPSEGFSRAIARMEEEMEDLMSRFFRLGEGWEWPAEGFIPRVNLAETEGELEVTVDLPGLKPEEVKVELREGALWITGERKEEKEEKGKTYHRVERHYGEFRRAVPLPAGVEEAKIEAKFENGVLKITARKTEAAKPKHIEVKA
jgi:HSP20 family protein